MDSTDFITHLPDNGWRWTNKGKTRLLNSFGKIGIFGQKAIARVNGIRRRNLRSTDDGRNRQVTLRGGGRSNAYSFIREADVIGRRIRFGIDGYHFNTKFSTGP